jgi:hypothetical protein
VMLKLLCHDDVFSPFKISLLIHKMVIVADSQKLVLWFKCLTSNVMTLGSRAFVR